ncbi:MAG: enoyl-CoA hydratase/isomerase family protein [Frankiaceae bacterium]|nr:enoyl-CoA hydratase/isomerase family protein [Frankiaceae bacterium]
MSEVLYDVRDHVALIILNRPEKLNAWTPPMSAGYREALDNATTDSDVRVVVLTGAGRGFCAGADLELLGGLAETGARVGAGDREPAQMEPAVPKPVIAAVNGPCAGLGFVRAMFCDIRFAAAGAKFTTAFARRGLVAEYGLSWLLPRIVGMSRSLDVLLSGRVFLAEEALSLGLVNRVIDGDVVEAAMDYARELATYSSPASLADMKRQVWADSVGTLAESWERTEKLMLASFDRDDLKEGVASYLENRAPNFPPLTHR